MACASKKVLSQYPLCLGLFCSKAIFYDANVLAQTKSNIPVSLYLTKKSKRHQHRAIEIVAASPLKTVGYMLPSHAEILYPLIGTPGHQTKISRVGGWKPTENPPEDWTLPRLWVECQISVASSSPHDAELLLFLFCLPHSQNEILTCLKDLYPSIEQPMNYQSKNHLGCLLASELHWARKSHVILLNSLLAGHVWKNGKASETSFLTQPLFGHQKVALAFLLSREQRTETYLWKRHPNRANIWVNQLNGEEKSEAPAKSSLLADDMGLGKTVTSIALIMETLEHSKSIGGDASQHESLPCLSATLLILPASLITQWVNELKRHVGNTHKLRHMLFHGVKKNIDANNWKDADLVITTYSMVRLDFQLPKKQRVLFNVEWYRIILDEAHHIKDFTSRTSVAVCNLNTTRQLCLSGTPIQNGIIDLFSLFKFMKISPFNTLNGWNEEITKQLHKGNLNSVEKCLTTILGDIMLRRTKKSMSESLSKAYNIPGVVEEKIKLEFDNENGKFYFRHHDEFQATFGKIQELSEFPRPNLDFLPGLMALRRCCDHPKLFFGKKNYDLQKLSWRESPKIVNLISRLDVTWVEDPEEKVVIFSEWTDMLSLIGFCLTEKNVPFLLIEGGMNSIIRSEVIDKFKYSKTRILLISLKAGGEGLNLVMASTVYLMEPYWNPAVEHQAIDRLNRIGQLKMVKVFRYIMENSIEVNISRVQSVKLDFTNLIICEDKYIGEQEIMRETLREEI